MASQPTVSPLLDSYGAWLRWLQALAPTFVPGGQQSGPPGLTLAPEWLSQPINPGWSFGGVYITNQNSGDPELERRILDVASYGRQIGRVMDTLAVVVAQLDPDGMTGERRALTPNGKEAFDDFWDVMKRIREAKSAETARRLSETGIARLAEDLKRLRDTDAGRYERLAAILRDCLDGP
ncbi:MAG TPA: hypothetical protein VKA32_01185 [Gammaproteobacteria bacterium]|nr:hypothetical protein [Gammaproteobacteria bacterium]